jgi:hypothetical protein
LNGYNAGLSRRVVRVRIPLEPPKKSSEAVRWCYQTKKVYSSIHKPETLKDPKLFLFWKFGRVG